MEIPAASQKEKATLGQGYNTKKEEFVGQCVRGEVEYAGAQEASLNFDRSMEESSMARELGFEIGAKARYGLYSGSLAAQFASASSSSEHSDVTVYNHTIVLKNAKLKLSNSIESGLTAEGRSARGTTEGNRVGENWCTTCGDEFVSQITLGGKLMIAIKVEFATREEKMSFGAQFSFKGPPLDVEANLKLASSKFGKRASVSIQAYQLGGDVRRLSSIFGTGPGVAPILTASMENPTGILETLGNAVRYSATDFKEQMDPAIPIDSPNGPAHLSYITSPWQELGLYPAPALVLAGVTEARRLLSAAFERHAANQRRLTHLLYGPIRLSPRQLQRCQSMLGQVSGNLAMIQEAALVAYSDFRAAVAKVNQTVSKLTEFVPEDFDIIPESFAQWWDMRPLPETLVTDKNVVDEIANIFIPRFNNFDGIDDQGLALQRQIEQIDSDDFVRHHDNWVKSPVWSVFAEAKIKSMWLPADSVDLKKARWLPHLQELIIPSSGTVQSLEGVEALSELMSLSASGPITSLKPLNTLNKLVKLSISQNRGALRGDLSSLAGKLNLRELSLLDAGIEDVTQIANLPLENIGLHDNPLKTVAPLARIRGLKQFWFGFGSHAIPGLATFSDHPLLANLFVKNSTIRVLLNDRPPAVWKRKLDTNFFEIKEENGDLGQEKLVGMSSVGLGISNDDSTPGLFLSASLPNGLQRSLFCTYDAKKNTIDNGTWTGPAQTKGTWTAT